jgi:hypothetical protein
MVKSHPKNYIFILDIIKYGKKNIKSWLEVTCQHREIFVE